MRMTYLPEEKELQEFAQRAAIHFEENPQHRSYSDREIDPGCLLAIRWGGGDDCVLVLKLDEFFEPVNYQNLIHKEKGNKYEEISRNAVATVVFGGTDKDI